MSQTAALLQAIHADPDDLGRRMVYADALMADGDPRGTFITQQCRLETMDPLDVEYPKLRANTERLRATHAEQWLTPLLDLLEVPESSRARAAVDRTRWSFERGFVTKLVLDLETGARVAGALSRLEPIDGLELLVSEWIPDPQRSFPEVDGWRYLGVVPSGWFTDHSLAHVLSWGLSRVRELSLARCSLGVSGCQLLANEPTDLGDTFPDFVAPPPLAIGQLRSLDLRGCAIGDAGLEVLARAATLGSLESLDLTQNRLGQASLDHLRKSSVLTPSRSFSLAGNNDLGPRLGALAGWPPLARLRRLALPQTTTPEALAALFPQPSAALRELVLTSSDKTLGQQPALVASCAVSFTHLDLGTTRIGDGGLARLLAAPSTTSLTSLKLNGCSLSDKAIATLVNSKLERLNELDLSSNKLTNVGLTRLAAWPGLRYVTALRLSNNRKLGRDGYAALAASPHFEPAELLLGKVADADARDLLADRYGGRVFMTD